MCFVVGHLSSDIKTNMSIDLRNTSPQIIKKNECKQLPNDLIHFMWLGKAEVSVPGMK